MQTGSAALRASIFTIAPAWMVRLRVVAMPIITLGAISCTLKSAFEGLPCWPATASICVPSGLAAKSFTSLTPPRCSQRE